MLQNGQNAQKATVYGDFQNTVNKVQFSEIVNFAFWWGDFHEA